jgi:hypothetical protein
MGHAGTDASSGAKVEASQPVQWNRLVGGGQNSTPLSIAPAPQTQQRHAESPQPVPEIRRDKGAHLEAGVVLRQDATDMTAPPANLGDSKPAIILNLTTKEWHHQPGTEWIPWVEMPRSFIRDRLKNMPVKGRKSREDKDAEERSDQILRSQSWVVSNETPFHILEQLVQMLCVSFFGFVSVCWSVRLCVLFLIAETA